MQTFDLEFWGEKISMWLSSFLNTWSMKSYALYENAANDI